MNRYSQNTEDSQDGQDDEEGTEVPSGALWGGDETFLPLRFLVGTYIPNSVIRRHVRYRPPKKTSYIFRRRKDNLFYLHYSDVGFSGRRLTKKKHGKQHQFIDLENGGLLRRPFGMKWDDPPFLQKTFRWCLSLQNRPAQPWLQAEEEGPADEAPRDEEKESKVVDAASFPWPVQKLVDSLWFQQLGDYDAAGSNAGRLFRCLQMIFQKSTSVLIVRDICKCLTDLEGQDWQCSGTSLSSPFTGPILSILLSAMIKPTSVGPEPEATVIVINLLTKLKIINSGAIHLVISGLRSNNTNVREAALLYVVEVLGFELDAAATIPQLLQKWDVPFVNKEDFCRLLREMMVEPTLQFIQSEDVDGDITDRKLHSDAEIMHRLTEEITADAMSTEQMTLTAVNMAAMLKTATATKTDENKKIFDGFVSASTVPGFAVDERHPAHELTSEDYQPGMKHLSAADTVVDIPANMQETRSDGKQTSVEQTAPSTTKPDVRSERGDKQKKQTASPLRSASDLIAELPSESAGSFEQAVIQAKAEQGSDEVSSALLGTLRSAIVWKKRSATPISESGYKKWRIASSFVMDSLSEKTWTKMGFGDSMESADDITPLIFHYDPRYKKRKVLIRVYRNDKVSLLPTTKAYYSVYYRRNRDRKVKSVPRGSRADASGELQLRRARKTQPLALQPSGRSKEDGSKGCTAKNLQVKSSETSSFCPADGDWRDFFRLRVVEEKWRKKIGSARLEKYWRERNKMPASHEERNGNSLSRERKNNFLPRMKDSHPHARAATTGAQLCRHLFTVKTVWEMKETGRKLMCAAKLS